MRLASFFIALSFAAVLGAALFAPVAPAQAVNLIPSGPIWSQIDCNGPDCTYCDFVTLISVITQYLIFLGVAIGALAFAYAGWLYMTVSIDGTGNIARANGIFTSVVTGIILMLIAYLIINLILAVLINGADDGTTFLLHPWDSITCAGGPTYANPAAPPGLPEAPEDIFGTGDLNTLGGNDRTQPGGPTVDLTGTGAGGGGGAADGGTGGPAAPPPPPPPPPPANQNCAQNGVCQ